MILYVVILFVVLLILGLLFVPIQIYIDTDTSRYFVKVKGLAKINLEPDEKEIVRVRMRILFFEHSFYPITKPPKPKKKVTRQKARPKRRLKFRKMVSLVRTFEIRSFAVEMDTGDYVANAKMYPLFVLLNQYVGSFHINFQDRNRLLMDMRNRPIRMIKSIV